MERNNDRATSRPMSVLVWAVMIGGLLLLLGWIFGFPGGGAIR
jgi:hypothetical protein